jgi:pimeloyl-ACP methyl ester carboxylesterase
MAMILEVFHSLPAGNQSGHAPILFVHGSYCGAWIWRDRFMPYFAKRGYASHAVSLRGHGGSEGILAWASLADYVEDVASAVSGIGSEPILVGHSMGGLLVQHYLATHPVKAAVLLSTLPPSGLASSAMHMSMFSPDVLWQLGLLQSLGPQAVSPEIIHRAFFSDKTSQESVHLLMPKLQAESHRVSTELLCPAQPTPPDGVMRPPVLVLGGDKDAFLPSSAFRETATYFKGELEILPGAPHGLMLDDAWWQPTADKIIAWLKGKEL